MPAVLDADQRRKLEDALLRKAEEAIRALRRLAEGSDPDAVESQANSLVELLKTREFPTQRAAEFREAAKAIQRSAYQLSVDTLIREAERKGHHGDDKGRNEILNRAKAHFAKAVRFGADEEFRAGVERRVQASLLTSADGVDERTKKANARKLDLHDKPGPKPPGGIERRRAIRYMDPVLTVDIAGHRYRTVNWSIRGLLLEAYRGELAARIGDRLKLEIRCEDIPDHVPVRAVAHMVRVDKDRTALALSFPDMSEAVIELCHAMKEAGIQPEPER